MDIERIACPYCTKIFEVSVSFDKIIREIYRYSSWSNYCRTVSCPKCGGLIGVDFKDKPNNLIKLKSSDISVEL